MRNLNVARPLNTSPDSKSEQSRHLKAPARKDVRINWKAFRYYPQLNKVYFYVSEHPQESLTLQKAAGIAAMARNYFSVFFHRNTGVTFKYWVDLYRVKRAIGLLRSSNMQIIEVALDCGFADATTFTRTFRRIKGLSPREFRRRNKPRQSSIQH